ncbi:GTP-binding protein EngB [Nonlabens ulvanivorans]|nr:GTP-binding protein [Nonlabens ulvanivorans]GAK93707.1 GTP-binding protein EngB [Nonlabens ulvanivorans]
MKITSSEFVISNQDVKRCPDSKLAEYAFIGRSNVGNKSWHLVDLPGYGYARVSKTSKAKFQKFITNYFQQRRQLVCAFVLVDVRHDPQPIDTEFMEWLGENGIPFGIVFTKADKLKPNALERNVEAYKKQLLDGVWEEVPPYFVTSSSNGIGQEELLNYIGEINDNLD